MSKKPWLPGGLCLLLWATGCRGGETVSPGSKNGEPVVVMLGDSTTNFRPGAVKQVYSIRVEKAFDETGDDIEVINAGVGGDTTAGARKRFDRDVRNRKPALVVIQFGINDAAVDVWKEIPAAGPRVTREDYIGNLRWMIRRARKYGIKVILMTPNPLRWSEKIAELYGRPPYDAGDPLGFEKPYFRSYVAAMRAVAAEMEVPLIDIYAAYAEHEKETGETADDLLLDGVHPNDRGHALVAEKLIPVMRKLMALKAD